MRACQSPLADRPLVVFAVCKVRSVVGELRVAVSSAAWQVAAAPAYIWSWSFRVRACAQTRTMSTQRPARCTRDTRSAPPWLRHPGRHAHSLQRYVSCRPGNTFKLFKRANVLANSVVFIDSFFTWIVINQIKQNITKRRRFIMIQYCFICKLDEGQLSKINRL